MLSTRVVSPKMFLNSKPSRLTSAANKARLSSGHKLHNEGKDSRRKSPEHPNEVLVFSGNNNSNGRANGGNGNTPPRQVLPEVPNVDEMYRYLKETWDAKMREINDPNSKLTVKWIKN